MAKVSKRSWTYNGEKREAWIVRYFDAEGTRRQETFEKKKDADARRLKIENELSRGTHVASAKSCSMKDLAEAFLIDCERRHKAKDRMKWATVRNYRLFVRTQVLPVFGRLRATDVKPEHVQEWLDRMCAEMPRATAQTYFKALSVVLKFGVRRNLIGRNVIVEGGIKMPIVQRKQIRLPSIADLKHVLSELDKRIPHERSFCLENRRVAIGLALFSGLRRGEICGLHWENVDFDAGVIHVRHSRTFYDGLSAPKTWAGNRTVTPAPSVMANIRKLHATQGRPAAGPLLLTQRGTPLTSSSLYYLWKFFAVRAGIADQAGKPKWRFHDFRHAAASLLIAEGVTPLHVKAFMGHASVHTTMNVYGHLFPDDTRVPDAVETIAARMLPAATVPQDATRH